MRMTRKNHFVAAATVGLCMILLTGTNLRLYAAPDLPELSEGATAFQSHRWLDALAIYLNVLRQDPKNVEAHKYIPLTIREIEAQNHAVIRDMRLSMLSTASQRLEANRINSELIADAVADLTKSEERSREEHWSRWLEEAKVEHAEGHLPAAYDLLLRIIAEKADHSAAQQELSLLLSDTQKALDSGTGLLAQEHYALEGFSAYAQADLPAASVAWQKCRALVVQTYPAGRAEQELAGLHFEEYAKLSDAKVEEQAQEERIAKLFDQAVSLYEKGQFSQALEALRQVALANPEYPRLALYLVRAENGVEQERTRRLSEARRQEISVAMDKGVDYMEHEKYEQASALFQQVLALDPTNPSAQSYSAAVQAELQRLHDPKAAQIHYEAGLIAYASGKLEDATREWRIATRMDPQNEKASNALAKAQKELAFAQDIP
jgi:tetratricopeptide (TPR) repeat protein